ncbi:MAG: ABC transporter ATP-binding protein [Rhodospirillaceae bacterium]|nr:ABC transporter ATP-binding protein [Rhodospirillaceae bacterium]MBT4688768.1 ABC transporter ATP-binding protein [Rhodospirillaceae bacterium]MBT5083406.1 ABC transporter ATP-binding protein [Rhodospirillaceae bacterium]MBT5525544.1 ABC transporter ATP-binding protein [Rhodospirillaceae bacterium]MBT5880604.1 ABC transporter ATP-binding protein [Rhodospirillaceae bacterium]
MNDKIQKLRIINRLLTQHRLAASMLVLFMLLAALAESFGLSLVLPLIATMAGLESGVDGALGEFTAFLGRVMPMDARVDGLLLLLALAFLIKGVLMVLTRGLSVNFAMRLRQGWSRRLMAHYLQADYAYMSAQRHGTTVHNIAVEPYRAARGVISIFDFLNRFVLAVILTAILLAANWQATLTMAAIGLVVFMIIRRSVFGYAARFGKLRLRLQQEISAIITESVGAALQIKLFGAYDKIDDALDARLEQHRRNETTFQAVSEIPSQSTEFIIILFLSLGMIVLSHGFDLEPAAYLALIGFYVAIGQRLLTTVNFLIARRMKIAAVVPSLTLVDELLEAAPSREALEKGETFPALKTDVVLHDVAFSYGDAMVFSDLNMTIRRGATTAIIGPSGSGKSTLADLLLGLYEPGRGHIALNGRNLSDFSLASRRQHIGYVSQDPEVFHASIAENIRLGRPGASDDDVRNAARQANIDSFITGLTEGYDTVVGDRGVKLSGGQRQRLTIARVVLRQPEIYIFDEATSALDTESEQLIQHSIEALGKQATVIVIAHRLSTIRNADAIYQLDGRGGARQTSFDAIDAANAPDAPDAPDAIGAIDKAAS